MDRAGSALSAYPALLIRRWTGMVRYLSIHLDDPGPEKTAMNWDEEGLVGLEEERDGRCRCGLKWTGPLADFSRPL